MKPLEGNGGLRAEDSRGTTNNGVVNAAGGQISDGIIEGHQRRRASCAQAVSNRQGSNNR